MHKVIIDNGLCLGKKSCITVCDPEVFGWQKATGVSMATKLKLMIESRGYQAVVENEGACTACMKCVQVCPEGAIEVIADETL